MNFTPKVLIAEPGDFSEEAIKILQQNADVIISAITKDKLKDTLNNFDVMWMRLGFKIDESVLGEGARCKIIVTPVTGTDHIDEELCKKLGVEIISLKGETDFLKEVRATAELTIGMTITLMRNMIPAYTSVQKGEWNRDLYRGNELYEKKVGIIGIGRLGTIVAGYFRAFGAEVTGFDTRMDFPSGISRAKSMKELIENSDIVSVHVNYTKETENLLGEEEFSYFKEDSFLINTSRGGVIDETALLDVLDKGKIKGAALDVIRNEDAVNLQNPLIQFSKKNSNLLIFPHIGGNTYESFEKTETFLARKLIERMKEIF